jgi:hypothetical protein
MPPTTSLSAFYLVPSSSLLRHARCSLTTSFACFAVTGMSVMSICIIPLTVNRRQTCFSWPVVSLLPHANAIFPTCSSMIQYLSQLCICSRLGVPTDRHSFLTPPTLTSIISRKGSLGTGAHPLASPSFEKPDDSLLKPSTLPPEYYNGQFSIFMLPIT